MIMKIKDTKGFNMSMQHCFHCDNDIDTDFDAEHFEVLEDGKTECEREMDWETPFNKMVNSADKIIKGKNEKTNTKKI